MSLFPDYLVIVAAGFEQRRNDPFGGRHVEGPASDLPLRHPGRRHQRWQRRRHQAVSFGKGFAENYLADTLLSSVGVNPSPLRCQYT